MYQYTIQTENMPDLAHWGPILMRKYAEAARPAGCEHRSAEWRLQEMLTYDRTTAARLGQTAQSLDRSLYSAFGQSEVSVIYTQLNQYYVVMEVAPQYWQDPAGLNRHLLQPGGPAAPRRHQPISPLLSREAADRHHAAAGESHRSVSLRSPFHSIWPPDVSLSDATREITGNGSEPGHARDRAWLLRRNRAGLSAVAGHRESI